MKLRHALFATAMLAAAPAHAATYLITYTGTVSGSSDSGIFGAPGSLDGKGFTAVYTLTAPLIGANMYDDGLQATIMGGGNLRRTQPRFSGTDH